MGHIESASDWNVNPSTPIAKLTVLGIGGTTRSNSSSEKALRRGLFFAEAAGAEVDLVAGENLPDEIFDPGSAERSESAVELVAKLRKADVVLLSTPAYHGSISGCIKNALDYVEDMRSDPRPYLDGVPVGIICCAMGWQAGGATLTATRSIVHSLRGWPTPLGVIVNTGNAKFNSNFVCSDEAVDSQIQTMVYQAIRFAENTSTAQRPLDRPLLKA